MKIKKILNNNAVISENDKGEEIVVMGRGLAFQCHTRDEVDAAKVDKTFVLKADERSDHFVKLLADLDFSEFAFTEDLINYAKVQMGKTFSNAIYVTLVDHINTCRERAAAGAYVKNTMVWDIKRLYKDEFAIGREAVRRMNVRFGSEFDDNEAANIAMHFVNAELDSDFETVFKITKVISEILNIVKYHFKIVYDEESLAYYRFTTHLRFFTERMFSGTGYADESDDLFGMIVAKYPEIYECTLKIKSFLGRKYGYELGNEESLYLTVHITKVVRESKKIS